MDKLTLPNDKFITAKVPEICAKRPALMKKLISAESKRIVYFSAPAGYGKTVSAHLWLADSGHETIWITLDAYDNVPYIFYKLFCTGILSAQPGNKAMEAVLRSRDFASSPVEHTIRLLSEMHPIDKKYALVLDDFHELKNEEIRKSGLLVQKRLPSSFLTVVLTRNDVKDEHITVTGRERTMVISAADLAFSKDEIRDCFAWRGHIITDEESKAVYDITGGWPMGVNALALSGQIDIEQSSGQLIENYIKVQVWDRWDEELRDFMLKTCVVDEMSLELCNRLTGRNDSAELLMELCAGNSFVSRNEQNYYCYHQLFLEFLRSLRTRAGEAFPDSGRGIASEFYLEKGKYFKAFRYAIEARDKSLIAKTKYELLRHNVNFNVSIDDHVIFYSSLLKNEALEAVYEQNPYLYAESAWYYFLIGDAASMEKYMDLLRESLPVIAEKFPLFIENSILVLLIDPRKSFLQHARHFGLTKTALSYEFDFRGIAISLHLPYAHRTTRDYSELTDTKVLQELEGTLSALLKTQFELVLLLLQSGFLYEQNRLNEALEAALKTRSLISEDAGGEFVFCSYTHLASIYFAMGDNRKYAETIVQTEQYIQKSGAHYLLPNFAAFKTRNSLLTGNADAARAWLKNYFVTDGENPELYKIFRHTTTAMAYIVLARYDKAAKYVDRLWELGRDFRRPLDMAEAGVLKACMEWAAGKKDEAQETLKIVLAQTQKYGAIRVIAVEGAAVLPILKKIEARAVNEGGKQTLDIRYLRQVTIAAYEQSRRRKGVTAGVGANKPIKLSKRQRMILTLLAQGCRNADIAKELEITLPTVKSHCAAAYEELGVNNAMDAVVKARKLGFIE